MKQGSIYDPGYTIRAYEAYRISFEAVDPVPTGNCGDYMLRITNDAFSKSLCGGGHDGENAGSKL